MKKYATIKDIAHALDVSIATVSRALSNSPNINPETKKLVLEEAKRQNYKPNYIAQKLQTKRSKTIGLVIPEIQTSFFPRIILGIQKVLEEAGFQLLITQSQELMESEARNLKMLEGFMVEGILISICQEGENTDYYQELIDGGIPIVFFNRVSTKIVAPKVIINDHNLAFFATEHLIYNGFKRIFHFAGPENLSVSKERKKGFLDAMNKHHLSINEHTVIITDVFSEKAYKEMNILIERNILPEAIFCFNDPVALGVLKAIKDAGLKCPDDIALVGFSETEVAPLIDPPLTSVEQPTFEMGETVARLLLEQINQTPPPEPETVCLLAKLNIRKSSINPKIGIGRNQ